MSDLSSEMKSSEDSDMRYFPRWEVGNRMSFCLEGENEFYEGKTKDISCAGACIVGDVQIAPRQKIEVNIELSKDVSIKLNAHILWVCTKSGQRQMGITFYDTPDGVQELILKHAFESDKEKVLRQWYKGWNKS